MLSALLVIWIAVIPLAIVGAAWMHARAVATGRGGTDAGAACWERVARMVGRRSAMDLRDHPVIAGPAAATRTTAQHLARGATVTLLTPRSDLRRACATQRLRGRGGAGRMGWS